jgi:hypothetical protein
VLGAQHVQHGLADHRVVFHQQYSHRYRSPSALERLCERAA